MGARGNYDKKFSQFIFLKNHVLMEDLSISWITLRNRTILLIVQGERALLGEDQ